MLDRRRITRWQVECKAGIKLGDEDTFCECNLLDISLKGVKVALERKLEKDMVLKLTLALSDELIIKAEAWLAWQRMVDGYNLCGLYFYRITDVNKEKIYRFLRQDFPEKVDKYWKGGGETMEKFEDRRTFERFPIKVALRYLDLKANQEAQAHTYDISAKGIGLETSQELTKETTLEIWLQASEKSEPLYMRGAVAWSRMMKPRQYRAGIELERADLMGVARILKNV
ncbi:MAG: PilZ domain-containing protein [Candidatus Omnitrophota bacterium]|jgi:c-di-GMP-binding flagellar brake protein YcgR